MPNRKANVETSRGLHTLLAKSTPMVGVLIVLLAVYTPLVLLSALQDGPGLWTHHVLFNAPFLAAAIACWRRSLLETADRLAWRMQSFALATFLVGSIYGAVLGDFVQYPSIADACWLAFYVLSYVSIVLSTRAYARTFHVSTWLDGAIGGLGATALVSGFVIGPLLELTGAGWATVATNLAYPIADLLLVLILIAVGHALSLSNLAWLLMSAGFVVFAFGDVVFLLRVSNGIWVEGDATELFWPVGVTLIGLAACIRPRVVAEASPSAVRSLVPGLFATVAVVLLAVGQTQPLPPVAIVLAVLTLALAGTRMVLTLREVRNLAHSSREARRDYLTDLPNRRSMAEHLDTAMERFEQTSLLVLDLDRFNEINDSLGHAAGDQLLVTVGSRLKQAGPPGSMLARLGGDEFAVILENTDTARAIDVAQTYAQTFRSPFPLQQLQVPVFASIGVATAPLHAQNPSELLAAADIAMYQAKRDRLGVAAFRLEPESPSRDRLELIADLSSALDHNQFVLHYQPQLGIREHAVIGVEALVRWNHPTRGMLDPNLFVPMLSKSSLIHEFTARVVEAALAGRAALAAAGFPLNMSVNISAMDLSNRQLPEMVSAALTKYSVPADALTLEVTEDSVIADLASSQMRLNDLHAMGSRVSIDDYGTGQASLRYLRDLPVDELKLDRSFLAGAPSDQHNAAIVRSTIELAHALDLPIVAEGVEDERVLVWLRELLCDTAQGYHIARPSPLPELLDWLSDVSAAV